MSVTQYLDVGELERWMGEWREALLSEAGINYEAHDPILVLPVFIFDLPTKGEASRGSGWVWLAAEWCGLRWAGSLMRPTGRW
jgi:hypothetical protein